MRPHHGAARKQLTAALSRRSGASAAHLAEQLGVSLPTLHRMLAEAGDAVVSAGAARRTRYALRRAWRGQTAPWPVYAVDALGRAEHIGDLTLVHPQGSLLPLQPTAWPVPEASRDGWWDGLPYPLTHMRPQGYLGRQLARAHHRLFNLPSNPEDWSDDEALHMLAHWGSDCAGDWIVGNPAFERWQAGTLSPPPIHADDPRLPETYAQLAEQAIAAGVPGSSAAGEFPKFPALRERTASATPHVLVKFSGADSSPAVQRWADLLVCEHLALEAAATLPGVASAQSRVLRHAGRTFLEVERFDRHGDLGRSPLVSLSIVDATFLGIGGSDWPRLAERLRAMQLLSAAHARAIESLWWFGRLIANSDMHTGNLSLVPQVTSVASTARGNPSFAPAPTYDMLPMLYAPLAGGELPVRSFEPPLPLPTQRDVWQTACHAALGFWASAASDSRVSAGFAAECLSNRERLERVAQRA
jgi:hypothetical protein